MEIFEEVKKIICNHSTLDIDENEISPDTDLVEDLGINSIAMILIIIDIEEKYDISLDGEELDYSALSKLSYFINLVERLIREKESEL